MTPKNRASWSQLPHGLRATTRFVNRRRLTAYRADIGTPPAARPRRAANVTASFGAYRNINPGPEGSGYAARLGTADSTLPT